MDTDSDSETPSKRQKTATLEMCVICDIKGPCVEMAKPKDERSWKTLLKAAEIRNSDKILQYRDSQNIPNIYYHIECRKLFTHKKELERMQDQAQTLSATDTTDHDLHRLRSRQNSFKSQDICIFCDKSSKYKKGTNTREILCKSVDLRSDTAVRNSAEIKMDSKILRITSQELVAAEALYHRSCYRTYTCSYKLSKSGLTSTEVEGNDFYSLKEADSFSLLFDYIRNNVFQNPRVIAMTLLSDALVDSIKSFGIKEIKPQTKKHIRRKIEVEFGSSIEFVSASNGRLYVLPSNMSRAMLVDENVRIISELEALKMEYQTLNLTQTALKIRNDVKSNDIEQEWPPDPESLTEEKLSIPEPLTTFFQVLISGNVDTERISKKAKSLSKSFAQDCVFAISGGRQKPPKHILLPWTVKSLTGNVELIKILNRLGHGISYSVLEELDTALCLQKLAETNETSVALPANILPCVPTTLAFDNIDRLEETLSGEGTSHRVNGIIVQPQVPTVANNTTSRTLINTAKRRSISHILSTPVEPYIASTKRIGPQHAVNHIDKNNNIEKDDAAELALAKNFVWCLLRQKDPTNQKVSSWTGFNIQVRDTVDIKQDKIGYLPTINAPATDMSTVNEILQQCLKIIARLGLKEIVCVFDQALYATAAEIIWRNTETFKPVIIRMGVFHTLCNFMGIVGKRFKDAGLRDLVVESLVIAEGSIDAVLEGRKYNRAIRTHKLVYEAMMRLVWKGFLSWVETYHPEEIGHIHDTMVKIDSLHANICQEQLPEVINNVSYIHINKFFMMYKNVLRNDSGHLAAFWMSYLDKVEVVLGLIRATREGDWLLHLAMIREIIPWCFAYDRQNYARYLSVYYLDMTMLHTSHPDTYDHFLHGGFSVQRGEWNTFGRIPVDQTIEETVNRDTQTAGGTKGFSLNPGAINRYYITAEYRSICLRNIREMTNMKVTGLSHVDLEPQRVKKDECDVQAILDLVENKWLNPFLGDSDLVCLSTATTASTDICNDLLSAKEKGEKAYKAFKENRLVTDQPTEMFYDRLPRQQLKTFSSIQTTKKTKISGKEYILKADNKLFGHMVLVASSRHLDMKEVLRHPLGPLPWALASCDGTLKKTNKSSLARKLEKRADSTDMVQHSSACVIDAMMIVNKINGENRTFEDLSETIFNAALSCGKTSSRIDLVFDTYRPISIKNAERSNRGSDIGLRFCNINRGQRIQQWRRLLGSADSKTTLINFLVETWKDTSFLTKLGGKEMFVTSGNQCFKLANGLFCQVEELTCSHEEADTRMLLHAKHASQKYDSVIIVSEDTDVFILCLAFYKEIGQISIRCGTKNRLRYIDVNKVGDSLGDNVCTSLIAFHAFTGCDSVSAFSGRGKVSALRLIMKPGVFQSAMMKLGEDWVVPNELFLSVQDFTCKMYATNTKETKVNDLRYQIFRAKKGDVESTQLPPCEDTLYLHTLRANYQTGIWRRSLINFPEIPSPEDHGWFVEDGNLAVDWMKGLPAPQVVMEFMSCKCAKECKLPTCQCLINSLKCSPACKNQNCTNMYEEELDSVNGESSDEEEDDAASDII